MTTRKTPHILPSLLLFLLRTKHALNTLPVGQPHSTHPSSCLCAGVPDGRHQRGGVVPRLRRHAGSIAVLSPRLQAGFFLAAS